VCKPATWQKNQRNETIVCAKMPSSIKNKILLLAQLPTSLFLKLSSRSVYLSLRPNLSRCCYFGETSKVARSVQLENKRKGETRNCQSYLGVPP
jgi:hypothetical protein